MQVLHFDAQLSTSLVIFSLKPDFHLLCSCVSAAITHLTVFTSSVVWLYTGRTS